jgi:GT2 family glycosyltransferase
LALQPCNSCEISVVICTYNRAESLAKAVASLAVQALPDGLTFEVVVVDDGSTDATQSVILELAQSCRIPIRYVRDAGNGIAAARNRGVVEAHGRWIAFFDDDQIAERDWLNALYSVAFESGAPCIGGARKLTLDPDTLAGLSRVSRLILGEIDQGPNPFPCGRNALICTGNLMVERAVIARMGGFDPALVHGGEDTDFLMRLRREGIVCWYAPRAVVYHVIPAYRTEAPYLVWAAARGGECFAHRDIEEWGSVLALGSAAMRFAQALCVHAPGYALAVVCGNTREGIGHRCQFRRAVAYTTHVVRRLLPKALHARVWNPALQFRREREIFRQD